VDLSTFVPHIIALSAAYVLALPIAWDREKHARSAGLRTFPLVALATCAFIQATEHAVANSPEALARIVEGIIVGMGFIGGGAILKQNGAVVGTATAASLWVTGAMGLAVGLGSYDVAITICVFTFLTLKVLPMFKQEKAEDDST
jgi:putative Mg2+ transporter-C (MgtC) family protein